jgi:hypothetical protein
MKTLLNYSVSAILLAAAPAACFGQFNLNGEIRPRTEYRHGYQSLIDSGQSGSVFTSQRTRLNFNYSGDNLNLRVSVQDVRIWGSQTQSNSTDGYTSIHEAWGEYHFTPHFSVRAGRQELVYDDERLLGSASWNQQSRSHDLMLLKYADTALKFTAHFGVAYNQNPTVGNTGSAYTVGGSYKEMQFLWLNKKFGDLNASLLVLNNGAQSPVSVNSTRFFQTIGTHLDYKKGKLFASLRGYYQTGVDAALKDMQAYMLGADLAYSVIEKFTIGAGVEMMSGQSQTDTTSAYQKVDHVFNTLYGTGHKFNGYMDYFYAGNGHGNVGLQDIYLKLKYKTGKCWAGADVHFFMTGADVLDLTELGESGKYMALDPGLGTEVDLTAACNFSKTFSLQAGYSQFMATKTLEAVKGGKYDLAQNWAYLMLTFKPDFLNK